MNDSRETKQVIVMRTDLNMRKGKMVAQGCHAAMKVLVDRFAWEEPSQDGASVSVTLTFDTPIFTWLKGRFTKICVKAKSEPELLDIFEAAERAGIPCALIEDCGLTEFHGQPTKTCCAVGPWWADEIDRITGHLELL